MTVAPWRTILVDTICTLRQAGIRTAGAGRTLAEAWEPVAIEIGDSRILVFAAATADSGFAPDWLATGSTSGIVLLPDRSNSAVDSIGARVASVKRRGDIAVLSIHWGENSGYRIPRRQMIFAHTLIDVAGVDVLHGHSCHHLKGIKIY